MNYIYFGDYQHKPLVKIDCPYCAGTGLGVSDQTRCTCCNGRGWIYQLQEEDDQE
jgi:DnaJ-class molecular chaperone